MKMVKKQSARTAKSRERSVFSNSRTLLKTLGIWAGIPLLIYFAFFCIFTWPWISHFSGWYLADAGDGLQNVWNMWWIEKSVTDFQDLPWHTNFLHAPWGVSLLGQTLNPFNGFMGILLMNVFGLSLVHAFNVMIVFSFIVGGLTMFWLCYYFSKSYVASLVGGFIFTFSSYHFAHAIGHMQLVSLEWIPLFILLWWKFLKKPSYLLALGASFSLLLVLLCDYYYFLYSVIVAIFIFIYLLWRKETPIFNERKAVLPTLSFLAFSVVLILPLPIALLIFNHKEPLNGAHDPRIFSTDLFTPFLNGGFWQFHSLTDWYWKNVKAFTAESSTYLTTSLIVVFIVAWFKRRKINHAYYLWVTVALFFGIMSLGPRLHYGGHILEVVPMPYALLEKIIPGLKLSGMPVRMLMVTIFALAIIAAMVLAKINLSKWKGRLIMAAFVLVYALEVWPANLPTVPRDYPTYVKAIENLPPGVIIDNAAKSQPEQLLYQTEHEKVMPLGYISRTPKSLETKEGYLVEAIMLGQYNRLCKEYKVRYITTPTSTPLNTTYPIIYKDKKAIIYDLKDSPNC